MLLPLSIFIEKVTLEENLSPESLEGGMQNVLSVLSSKLSHDNLQNVLESSFSSFYTVALFCNHTLQESRPISCSLVIASWHFSQGASEGASQRLYQLLVSKEKYQRLVEFIGTFNQEQREGDNIFEFILLVLTRMLIQIGISDMLLYSRREVLLAKLDTPLGVTKMRVMVEQELVYDSFSGTMVVASLKSSESANGECSNAKIHLDFGYLRHTNCTPRRLLLALCYAAIIVDQLHIACCVAYLLGRIDIFEYIYDSHIRSEEEALAIVEFCFSAETTNRTLYRASERPSSRMIKSIEAELMEHADDMSCVEAIAVICRHLHEDSSR